MCIVRQFKGFYNLDIEIGIGSSCNKLTPVIYKCYP